MKLSLATFTLLMSVTSEAIHYLALNILAKF